jgi:hypothetical protein
MFGTSHENTCWNSDRGLPRSNNRSRDGSFARCVSLTNGVAKQLSASLARMPLPAR